MLSPPLPGIGDRILAPDAAREFWYQPFHQLALAEQLMALGPPAVRAYLRPLLVALERRGWELARRRARPARRALRRARRLRGEHRLVPRRSGIVAHSLAETTPAPEERIAAPTLVLWGSEEPLFPLEWSDRIGEFFADVTLEALPGVGHFTPLEAPDGIARGIRAMLARTA